ncbi:Rhs family protein [Frankia sp. QA3]|uniref:Rhs family protein n=1 Tax=Frankia sp. QA3 TaxID=710111 RepID=UPI000269BF00|nr:Rhs family protein [Frankia sp. QA3]EIV92716.1 Rhs family protein [Frankia sp. QA3]
MTIPAQAPPLTELTVVRDGDGRAVALEGDGVRHHRRDDEGGWTVIDDPAGATSLRQDEYRTELLRDGHLLAQRRAGDAEEWTVPGTPQPVRIERDPQGQVCLVLVGDRVVARRADGATARVLRWASGDVGHGPEGLFAAGPRQRSRLEWAARAEGGTLTLGRDSYRFDAEGRVVEHRHPWLGATRYAFAGRELAAVDTPDGRVELHHSADGRVRVRRDTSGRTTYGYDEAGRRVRETGPSGVRRLEWDGLDRLVAVADEGWTVRYGYDGFGRRVRRTLEGAAGTDVRLEHRDLQGRLWSVTDAGGRALRTFVWDRHRCLAAFDGPASGAPPAAVYVTAPSGVPVGLIDAAGDVRDLPATPYGEYRSADHPALWFHLADERTGYVHLTQRDADPATWQFLSADPYHGDDAADDRRRLLLGLDGPLPHERDDRTTPYAVCGFDPVRRVDPNGAISAGTVLWQIFGGLTWHLPAHTINWLWIHPFVNLSFASILAWLPAAGFDPRGAYDSWWEFWLPSNYSFEESKRQDIGAELMAGWMSSNRTFTFQNAIWGRRREWETLGNVASLQPSTPYAQQRPGSLLRISRGDSRAADAVDAWTMVADGIDTRAAATRQYDVAGGTDHEAILGSGRERLLTGGNLHVFRQIRSAGVSLPGTDPAAPAAGPIAMHSRATAVQECAPGAACALVTLRTTAQVFTYSGTDAATADGDVIRLGGVLTMVTAVQVNGAGTPRTATEMSVQPGNQTVTLPVPGDYRAQWASLDPAGAQSLGSLSGDTTRLQLPDSAVAWTPNSIARLDGVALAPVDAVESHLPVNAQVTLTAGSAVVALGAPVRVAAALEPDERLRVADNAVGQGVVLLLARGGGVRLARVTAVADDDLNHQDLLTLDATPTALGLPGAGDPLVDIVTAGPSRGTLAANVPPGAGDAVTNLAVNASLGANVVGLDVGGALATVTGAETRALHLTIANPVGGAGPWNVERFTFPAGARTHDGALSGPLEIVRFTAGDGAATIASDALLRLRAVTVPAAVPAVAGLVRVGDHEFTRPSPDPTLAAGDLLAVQGTRTDVVSVADLAITVTLDRLVGAPGDHVRRVCALVNGERLYDAVRVDTTVRLTGTTGITNPALLPDWVAGDIVQISIGGTTQEWVLDAAPDGGRLALRNGPGVIPGVAGAIGTVRRLAPIWPPLAREVTDPARISTVLAQVPRPAAPGTLVSQHVWITGTGALTGAVGLEINGTVFVARVDAVNALSVRSSTLPPGPLAGYVRLAASSASDRISARWHLIGDEIRIDDQAAPTPAGGPTVVLDALAPIAQSAVTPKEQALMLPAEPENEAWILTARQALREHELRHTIQASRWGPMFLGLPLGIVGDALWDLRGGSGSFESSPFETVRPLPEETTGDRPRPAGFRLTAPTGQFRLGVGEVVEFELDGRAWRTVIIAVDQGDGGKFWVRNLPPDGLGEATARARTLHHTEPQGDAWLKIFRILDLLTNAHIMEFSTGLIWEGLIGLFWRAGRLMDFKLTSSVDVTVTDAGRVTLHAADEAALAKLHLDVGGEVIVDSDAARDDSTRTVVTGLLGADVTVRDAVPRYPGGARIRLWRGQGKDPDDVWDLRTYRPATLEAGAADVISVPGDAPGFRPLDVLVLKWTGSTGTRHSLTTRVTTALDGAPPRYRLADAIDLDGADPDTLRLSRLRDDDDPATQWFDTGFYETPIRIRRVTRYLFDPWRAFTLGTEFTQPADGSTFKTVLAWIARGVRYAVSNRTWTPLFGYVWWTSIFGRDSNSGLEQSASWNGGDLYSTITRSGDPRFAASEGGHGDEPGSYGIFEGELLRMWTWESWRWNDVFASIEAIGGSPVRPVYASGTHTATQNPALISAASPVTPWDDRWRFTPPTGLVTGLEYPAELAQSSTTGAVAGFRPSPLLQIPTRADVARNSGVYFVACQAGAWRVGVAKPTGIDTAAQGAGAQYHTRTVQVGALTVTAGGTNLPWQPPGAAAALTLFLTQELPVDVTGGNGGTYRLRLLDPQAGTVVNQTADLSLRARIITGTTETVEVVRVYRPDDPCFARFGTYLAQPIAIPVRRFGVTVTDTITLRNGPDPTSPVASPGAPVRPGAALSALLPVTTSALPTVAFAGPPPVGAPPLPVVTGPSPAGNLNRYQIAVDPQPPEQSVTLRVTFRFADPNPAGGGATRDVVTSFDVQPAATLSGPALVGPGATVLLTVVPSDGAALVAADVTLPSGADVPVAGVTVSVTAAGELRVAAGAGAPPGTPFLVRALWKGQPARSSMAIG